MIFLELGLHPDWVGLATAASPELQDGEKFFYNRHTEESRPSWNPLFLGCDHDYLEDRYLKYSRYGTFCGAVSCHQCFLWPRQRFCYNSYRGGRDYASGAQTLGTYLFKLVFHPNHTVFLLQVGRYYQETRRVGVGEEAKSLGIWLFGD